MSTQKKQNQSVDPATDENFNVAYRVKLESQFVFEGISSSAVVVKSHQASLCGYFDASATGSPSTTKVVNIPDGQKQNDIVFVNAHAVQPGLEAKITDVTSTQVTIQVGTYSGNNFSDVTTATVRVYFEVRAANP